MRTTLSSQVDAEEYFDDQREVEYFCFNQQYHRAPKQVPMSLDSAADRMCGMCQGREM